MVIDWSSSLDLHLDLAGSSGLGQAIERGLRRAIRQGRLAVGTPLPSTRSLAHDLGVARGTVSTAYAALAAEGYLVTRQGAPTRVGWVPPPVPGSVPGGALATGDVRRSTAPRGSGHGLPWDLLPGRPSSTSFPRAAWARAMRRALARAPQDAFGYGEPHGHRELRSALADYLGRARGVATTADHILICSGFTQAWALICQVLRDRGITTVAVEDPSAPRFRATAIRYGLDVEPVPCDDEGLRVDALAASPAGAVLVTPAHQYPLGVTMTPARRTELIRWARERGAYVVEDDYDGEFRYDRRPVGALQQMDPEHVVYAGTASKSLAPGLRLGWLACPRSLTADLAAAKTVMDRGGGVMDQLALAELITSGSFDAHIRRMRTTYRRRRDELVQTLSACSPVTRLSGGSAGLHALILLPEGMDEEHTTTRAATHLGLALRSLSEFRQLTAGPQALVVGYGSPADHAYRPALAALSELLGSVDSAADPGR